MRPGEANYYRYYKRLGTFAKLATSYIRPSMSMLPLLKQWIRSLTSTEALRKAGIRSKNFWLKSFIK